MEPEGVKRSRVEKEGPKGGNLNDVYLGEQAE